MQLEVSADYSLCSAVVAVQLLGEMLQGRFRGQRQDLACLSGCCGPFGAVSHASLSLLIFEAPSSQKLLGQA